VAVVKRPTRRIYEVEPDIKVPLHMKTFEWKDTQIDCREMLKEAEG